jgi:hypothetical protein
LLVRDELVGECRAEPHHVHPESGWVSYYIHGDADVPRVLALFRLNYERPWRAKSDVVQAFRLRQGYGGPPKL